MRAIDRDLVLALGDAAPVEEWIRKAHRGEVDPTTVDLVPMGGLARYYGVTLDRLHPALSRRYRLLVDAVDGSHPRQRSSSRAEQRRPRDGGTTIGTGDGTYRSHHRYHHSRQRMMRLALVNRPARQSCSV